MCNIFVIFCLQLFLVFSIHYNYNGDDEEYDQIVSTQSGLVEGFYENNVTKFFGIPYAKSPVDYLRWRSPQLPDPWGDNVFSAQELGPMCPQVPSPIIPNTTDFPESEDCLTLNIFTPYQFPTKDMKLLPVMIWIHGGAFTTGTGALYNGSHLAIEHGGTIIVTFNYRLGVLGWFALEELASESWSGSTGKIGRAVQQECRDRSRMPSSA
eukprot:TRINITY_DN38636_c0_g1_i2.p1 TRINITY_DN38636_c0_g1~~TRINITY_DN38636_c0_g1_i2.p1  ORF type:complete len:210 (+),score=21.40 TRINITY_DN38636_c0_g1_i2:114-743(+)